MTVPDVSAMTDEELEAARASYTALGGALNAEYNRRRIEKFHIYRLVEFTQVGRSVGGTSRASNGGLEDLVIVEFEDADGEEVSMYIPLDKLRLVNDD